MMAVTAAGETCAAASRDCNGSSLASQRSGLGADVPVAKGRSREKDASPSGWSRRAATAAVSPTPASALGSATPSRIPRPSSSPSPRPYPRDAAPSHGIGIGSSNEQRLLAASASSPSRRIRVYRNGDRFFAGLEVVVTCEKVRSVEALLLQLSRQLADSIFLAKGARFLLAMDGSPVLSLEQLLDGHCYVCSSGSALKKLDYLAIRPRGRVPLALNGVGKTAAQEEAILKRRSLAEPASRQDQGTYKTILTSSLPTISPKRISVFLNGPKPRQLMRFLLDDRSAQSFTHVLDEITRFFSPLPAPVRRVYNATFKLECFNLADFFHGDVFIASTSGKVTKSDMDLDPEEEKLSIKRKISRSGNRGLGTNSGTYVVSFRENVPSPRLSRRMTLPKGWGMDGSLFNVNHPPDIRDRYHIGRAIGNGNFASVHECIEWRSGRTVAMKIIEINKIRDKKLIGNEISILRRLKHPNIVNLLDEYSFAGRLYVVMELVKGGDLFSLISDVTHFSETQSADMVRCLCHALDYLHSSRVVHRDVKPENLLVMESAGGQRTLKLADFGLATFVKESELLMTICGSPTYVAPEILTETGYGFKVDIWAAGVTAFILLCGYPPFQSEGNHQETLFEMILAGEFEFRSPYWDHVSMAGKDLIRRMIDVDVSSRYHANQILDHEWMKMHCRLEPIREASVVESLSSDSGIQLPVLRAQPATKKLARSTQMLCDREMSQTDRKVTFQDENGAEVREAIASTHTGLSPILGGRCSKKLSSSSVRDLPGELTRAFWGDF
ncbi:serine/threonine-protein kinase DCLK1-like isoform X2 [Paramacrobiotus metropolitanus]|uniref:serine/threonine-protein kinase DCLK1-like isoform X2 n=1 Tax=Paramacrobiotus metropolitanus TaxID=2943436 RepID=UPI002446446A|nr:serine/threonine-protein kinase DCLK1-like isoform X2 [Paramacrobiotus metropolitanus]